MIAINIESVTFAIFFLFASIACDAKCPSDLRPGEHQITLEVGGVERDMYLYVPEEIPQDIPRPVVVMFHGCGSSPEKFELESLMNKNVDKYLYYNVYPKGTDTSATQSRLGWNADFSSCRTGKRVNDADFARAVVEYLLDNVCIDQDRVFAAGFSNGGSMIFNLTCEMQTIFRAYSFTGSTMPSSTYPSACGIRTENIRPVLGVCGGLDGCASRIAGWFTNYAGFSNCLDEVNTTRISDTTTCHSHHRCGQHQDEPLEYCLISGLGHCWSGNDCCDNQCLNQNPENLDASDYILRFFDSLTTVTKITA